METPTSSTIPLNALLALPYTTAADIDELGAHDLDMLYSPPRDYAILALLTLRMWGLGV